jgi:hypothetical protein
MPRKKMSMAARVKATRGTRVHKTSRRRVPPSPWATDDEYLYGHPDAAEEIAGFVASRSELIQVVKFWYEVVLERYWAFFRYSNSGSLEASMCHFAEGRIRKIRVYLGNGRVDKALQAAEKEFSEGKNSKECSTFLQWLREPEPSEAITRYMYALWRRK